MKTFREHIKEEVKIGALASGGIDIERDAIRDEINGILSAIAVRPCVTPYASLNKIRKALAYFSIFLPKKVYLEGRHGIEVWEVNQFGDKMGFTDQGEWIKNVPCKYYLFFHYHRIGSMYYLEAKIVDDKELETKISTTEKMFAEEMDASMRQELAKAKAPKEDPHTALGDCDCSQGDSPSTKKAIKVSMKKIDEDKDPCWKGYEMIGMKKKGGRKVPNCVPVEEANKEPVYTHEKGPLYGTVTDHGEGKFSTRRKVGMFWRTKSHKSKESAIAHLQNKKLKEEQIDELYGKGSLEKIRSHHQGEANKLSQGGRKQEKRMGALGRLHRDSEDREDAIKHHMGKAKKARGLMSKLAMREETLEEKAPPGAKFERMVKHIKKGYSKDGLTKKEKSIAYATAWKAKNRESKD